MMPDSVIEAAFFSGVAMCRSIAKAESQKPSARVEIKRTETVQN